MNIYTTAFSSLHTAKIAGKRFRKINYDGTDAPVKIKKMKNIRQAPATIFNWQSDGVSDAFRNSEDFISHTYLVEVLTDHDEKETFKTTALNPDDAAASIREVVESGRSGLIGEYCEILNVKEQG